MENKNFTPIHFAACDNKILSLENEKENEDFTQDLRASFKLFIADSGSSKFCIFPNFNQGIFTGPQGYVTQISLTRYFSSWCFLQPIFRVISFFEVNMNDDAIQALKTDEIRDMIRKTFPIDTCNPPTLTDTSEGEWSPALGDEGSNIGIYSFTEKVLNDQVKRFFIGVHSGLHYQTVRNFQDHLIQITYKNIEFLEKQNSYEMHNNSSKLETYETILNSGIFKRLNKISKENNRRLATQFARTLKINFKNDVIPLLTPVRSPMFNTTKFETNAQLSKELLKWWPKNGLMYIDSTVKYQIEEDDKDSEIVSRLYTPEEIENSCIGVVYESLKKKIPPEQLSQFNQSFKFNLLEKRETVIPDIECDYNTFRVQNGSLIYYNNCTCTTPDIQDPAFAVVKQLSLSQGYEIFNSMLSQNHVNTNREQHYSWTNNFCNGFPVIYPQIKREDSNLPADFSKFFSFYNGFNKDKMKFPKQLNYVPKQKKIYDDPSFVRDLYPITFIPNMVQLLPEFVYLGGNIHFDSCNF